jgi:hypothetical protein
MGFGRLVSWGAATSGIVEPENYVAARERYESICGALGIHRAPALRPAKKVTMLSKIAIGDWLPRKVIRVAAFHEVPTDHFFLHELAHVVCPTYAGYRGYHGAPFLAVLQLLYDYHWQGDNPDAISYTVEEDWPRYIGPIQRELEIAAARAAVETVKGSLAEQDIDQPGADLIAKEVRKCFPGLSAPPTLVGGNRFSREVVMDMINTQRDGLFTLLLWESAAAALILGTVFHFFPNVATGWIAGIAGAVAVGVIASIASIDMSRRVARLWRRIKERFVRPGADMDVEADVEADE